jgi:tRNA (guanine-N7-)-methyltransferase
MCPRPNHPYAAAPRLPEGDTIDLGALLPGSGPVEIEIGPGRGGFVFERCALEPDVRLLGLEVRLKWAALVDERLARVGLHPRARVLAEDAKAALARLGPSGTVRAVFVHFPDPWWKKKHTKRLVVGAGLLESVARLLEPGGELFVQTDVEERAERYATDVAAVPAFIAAGDAEGSPRMAENPYGARSPRERRAIADGLPVVRMRWRRAAG